METLSAAAERRYPEFVDELERMVNVDCGSYTPAGVNDIVDMCHRRFAEYGWQIERRPHEPAEGEPQLGDLLIGRLEGSGGPRVLMIGHMDTVFDPGTAAARPFRIEGERALGPGVSDMKGGLLTGFFATHVLQDAGFGGFGAITYVCNPDEEIGSPFSGPIIRELASDHDVALVLEAARENGDIVSARKGITDYTILIEGRSAHAGVEPERGRSAVLEAAHKVLELQGLTGRWPDVTVNVGVVHGGTRPNVVAERCELQLDLRSPVRQTLEEAERAIEEVCAQTTVPDVRINVVSNGWHRPMEKTEASARLVAIAAEVAAELGFELRDAATGGASDANTTSAVGTPTIDGLGPIGGDDHSEREWLDLSSVVPRVALLAGIVTRV